MCVFHIRSSLHSFRFGQLLRCARKVYIERNKIQVELIRFRKNSNFIDVCKAREFASLSMFTAMAAIGHEQINNYPFARWQHPSLLYHH